MGNFMIPVCCVCGKKAKRWHDDEWYLQGGKQDFCPRHAKRDLIEYFYGITIKEG
jgi:hypothetical protein